MSSKRICLRALNALNQPSRATSQFQRSSQIQLLSLHIHQRRHASTETPSSLKRKVFEPVVVNPARPKPEDERQMQPKGSTFAAWMRSGTATMAETYVSFEATYRLFEACGAMADYTVPNAKNKKEEIPTLAGGEQVGVGNGGWWYEELKLEPTFSTWAHITMLHMWILLVRFRAFPRKEATEIYHRHLLDHFSFISEQRMAEFHRITSRSQRNNFLKDLYLQWRGTIAAFDEGLVKGDAVLGAAVWRNIFGAKEDTNWEDVAKVVAFTRRVLAKLGELPDEEIVDAVAGEEADSIFEIFDDEAKLVEKRSQGIDQPIADAANGTKGSSDPIVENAMKSAKA